MLNSALGASKLLGDIIVKSNQLPYGLSALLLSAVLSGCGGDGGNDNTPPPVANRAPTVSLSNIPTDIREGEAFSFSINGSDPDGNNLIYTLATTEGPDLGLSVSGTTGNGTAPSVDGDSAATIRVTASDGRLSATSTSSITILNNAPPTASLTAAESSVREGNVITLDASASADVEGDDLTYSYAVIAGPDVDLTAQAGSSASFNAPDVDADTTFTVEVSVNDGRDVTTETANITILNNAAPIASLTATPMTVDEGEDIEFNASASTDAEDDDLTFSYVQISGPSLDLENTGETFTTSAPEVNGDSVVTVEVQVNDGRDTSTQRVDVNVTNVVQTPAFPETLDIQASRTLDGELFGIEGFLNPTTDGIVAVSDVDGGLVGLRTVQTQSDGTFSDISDELLTPQFERGASIREGTTGIYLVVESDGITVLQQDTSQANAVISTVGKIDIDNACTFELTNRSFNDDYYLVVGKPGGVDLYTVSISDGNNQLDFDSLNFQSSVVDGNDYCAFTRPSRQNIATTGFVSTSFIGLDKNSFEIQRFEINDNGAGGVSLTATRRHSNPGLPVGNRRFVKGFSRTNFPKTMTVVIADESRSGNHSVQYITERFETTDIRVYTGNWQLGRPTDLAIAEFEAGEDDYIFAITPDTPQAVGFSIPDFGVASGPLEATYLEVGLGASIAYGTTAAVGDMRDNNFAGLVLGYPEKRQITRFDQSDLPDN
jgi:hypothetical protein